MRGAGRKTVTSNFWLVSKEGNTKTLLIKVGTLKNVHISPKRCYKNVGTVIRNSEKDSVLKKSLLPYPYRKKLAFFFPERENPTLNISMVKP